MIAKYYTKKSQCAVAIAGFESSHKVKEELAAANAAQRETACRN
jgi:hypothetical protein